MKTFTAVAIVVLSLVVFDASSQSCTNCTQTISSSNSGALNVNAGDVVCITSTGSHNGTVYLNGGILCNEGEISGNVFQYGGEFNNYGLYTTGNFQLDGGIFVNEGHVDIANFIADGDTILFINNGLFEGSNYTLTGNGGAIVPEAENNAEMFISNYTGSGSNFENNDTMDLTGSLHLLADASFENFGPLHLDGSWQVDGSYFYTECTVIVDGSWTNQGEVEGPLVVGTCGGFEVHGIAINQGDLAVDDSYIDVCEVVGGAMASSGAAAQGTNVTECQCSTTCSGSGGGPTALIETSTEQFLIQVFPNPANDFINITASGNSEFMVADMCGRIVAQGTFSQGISTLDISGYAPGVYFIAVPEHKISKKVVVL